MTTQTVKIPNSKKADFNSFVEQIGGEVVATKKTSKPVVNEEEDDEDEVTHGVFFGENIKRVIKAFKKS